MSRRFAVEDFATNADRFAAYEDLCDQLEAELSAMTQRAEAAEARIKTVPKGWKLVPNKATGEMMGYGTAVMHNEKGRNPYFIVQRIYEGMFAAAPQSGGSNE